jgi:hypothetical protein
MQFENDPQLKKYYVIDLVGEGSFGKVCRPKTRAHGRGLEGVQGSAACQCRRRAARAARAAPL